MKAIITGGLGFIGHNLAQHFKNLGFSVICIDNLSNYNYRAINKTKAEGIETVFQDVKDFHMIRNLVKGADVVVHCAAYISVMESINDPVKYFDNNVGGTTSIVKSCVDGGVARIVYLSSAAVYGRPEKLPIDEVHPTKPISPYGLTKLMAEQVIEYYAKLYGLKYVTLRLFNVYGPGQVDNEYSGVITKFIKRIKEGKPLIIYGDGEQTRDFVHVKDVCIAIEKASLTANINQIYNIGSGKPTRIIDLVQLLIGLSGLEVKPIHEAPREGEIRHSYADIARAERFLGFKPVIELGKGIEGIFREDESFRMSAI
ncbi:MAG: NAD-dependent epimerase/dehydratase family protein [Thermoproteota archaeon]